MHNLVKSFLTSIKFTLDNLSRKIKNPCLVINKNFLKEDFTMKSKQIIIMLLSFIILFAISCKNDDKTGNGGGGSLNIPTASGNPASVGNVTLKGNLTRTGTTGQGELIAPDTTYPNFQVVIANNKATAQTLLGALASGKQLFGDGNIVAASGELVEVSEGITTTSREYIKLTLDNAQNPTKAEVEYIFGSSNSEVNYTVTYTGTITKQ